MQDQIKFKYRVNGTFFKNVFQCMARREVWKWDWIEKFWDIHTTYARSTCANNCKGVDPNSIIGYSNTG